MCPSTPSSSSSSDIPQPHYHNKISQKNADGCGGDIESTGGEATLMLSDDDKSLNFYQSIPIISHDYSGEPFNGSVDSVASFSDSYTIYFESNKGMIFATLNLAIYLILAIFAYSFWFEEWSIIDSLYFAVCTFTTIGYGDMFPSTDPSRLFTAFFAVYGIVILGFFVGLVGEKVVELHNQALEAMQERHTSRATHMFQLTGEEAQQGGAIAANKRREQTLHHRIVVRPPRTMVRLILDVMVKESPLLGGILLVAIVIGHFQGWSIASSIYYGVITSTTVGFGDLSIHGQLARGVCIVALPLMVAIVCEVLSRMAGAYLQYKIEQEEANFLNRRLTVHDLIQMDENEDGEVEWAEFMSFMLQAMGKVQANDIEQLREIFDKFDTSRDGVLSKEDLLESASVV